MTPLVAKLKQRLEEFDQENDSQRELLIEYTIERFRRRLDEFNKSGDLIVIEGFTTGYGNLEMNKNAYYLFQYVVKQMEQNYPHLVNELYDKYQTIENETWLSFRDTYFPQMIESIGGKRELNARLALTGKCRLRVSNEIMSSWINTQTMMYLNTHLQMFGQVTSDDIQSLIKDVLNSHLMKYYTLKSVEV